MKIKKGSSKIIDGGDDIINDAINSACLEGEV